MNDLTVTVAPEIMITAVVAIQGPPGSGGPGGTGTVQSVNNILPDAEGNIEIPLDFAAALTTDQNYVTDNQAAALAAADTLSADNPVATMQDVIHSALVGVSANLFFCDDASPIAGWHELEAEATAQPSGEHSAVLAYNVLTLLDKYVSAPLNATRVPAGMWEFNLHAKMSSITGTNLLDIQLLIVHANGTTTVPTGWNVPIRSVDVNSTAYAAYAVSIALPAAEGLALTDRVGVIVSGIKTTAGADATMFFSHDLTSGNLSNVQTPMVAKIKGSDVELLAPSGTGNLPDTVTDVEKLKLAVDSLDLGIEATLSSIIAIQLAACPRMDFQVWGDSTDGGITPDSTTQTSIDALLTAGVPESNIVWRYTPLAGTFTIASLASTATIDTVTLLAGNYFVVADLTVPSSIDNVTLVGLTESVFYDSTPIAADGVLAGIYNFNTTSLNKSGAAFTPTSTADISKIAMRITSRAASVHNTANTIRCRIFSDNGSGLPNIATGLIATATAAGISANDTIFTPVFVFATSADNYASKINFASGVKKHFVFDIPTASGNTAYSTVGQDTANASYPEQYTIYTSDSGGTTWAQQVWEPKFTLYKVA